MDKTEDTVKPNSKNFCGGAYSDWLEVNLLSECNGKCEWCIEKNGFHPSKEVNYIDLVKKIESLDYKKIILLGGEPTLYSNLKSLISLLKLNNYFVYITTNGSRINKDFVSSVLFGLSGLNISIHHFDLENNKEITGLDICCDILKDAIDLLHTQGTNVRFNCNVIKGQIDSEYKISEYIKFAKFLSVDSVRFAELKGADNNFVSLSEILDYKYGLNNDPFIYGCINEVNIDSMIVNFRQMCGLHSKFRKLPINPEQYNKKVLYYDGVLYSGWQVERKNEMDYVKVNKILEDLKNNLITIDEAIKMMKMLESESMEYIGGGCHY